MNTKPYKTLIIDDEPPARLRLKSMIADFPETFNLIDEAANGNEGIEKIDRLNPDIIFLDIQMPDLTGFEMLKQLTKIPIVVFCTAYDEFSLQAFETNSLDYLLKPVRKERLAQTVDKLRFFKKEQQSEQLIQMLQQFTGSSSPTTKLTSLTIRSGKKITFIKLGEVSYFKAEEKYVTVHTKNGEAHLTDQSLIKLASQLPDNFIRIHRSIILNKELVKEIQPYFNSRFSFRMEDQKLSTIVSGRSYQEIIKTWLKI
ncbi:LytR/AlgR family response regulator transcription factor [Zhouia amylolytica]|uniref:LytR/AlgR family response regulator transcription factor n=1 Tax=Zhouia amylolytica TaxID=376730 RepID=UPI0020CD303A|nr:LytTR family DNA-binding domain-containing protein [Zhouia amylolytica]MCQ0111405.1 response regulator transcription factor [Zhouia amylolytica]